MESTRAQRLLRRPQRITPSRSAHHGQVLQAHARCTQRGGVRQVRRCEPGDAVSRGSQRRERRQHDLQLANALSPAQNLDQPSGRPAAAGKLGIERGVAGWRRRHRGFGGDAATPDGLPLEEVCKRSHVYCVYIQYTAAWQAAFLKPGLSRSLAVAAQALHLLHVGTHELTAENLVEIVLGIACQFLLVEGELLP